MFVTFANGPLAAARKALDRLLGTASAAILAITAAAVVWQVFTRYVLATPSTQTAEAARLLFMWMALLGGAYAFGQGRHLAIDFLPQALSGTARRLVEAVILAVVAAFAIFVMIWGGTTLVLRTLANGQLTPTLGLRMGWVYLALPISGIAIAFYCLWFATRIGRAEDIGVLPSADNNSTG